MSEAPQPSGSAHHLGTGQVHIWRVDLLAVELDAAVEVLVPEERERLTRYRREEDARRFGVTRAALRLILARYSGAPASRLAFDGTCAWCGHATHGKPSLSWPARSGLDFNVSHSGGVGLVAVGRDLTVGVDVESTRRASGLDELAGPILTAVEREEMASQPEEFRDTWLLRRWTGKEAVVKGLGLGLALDFQKLELVSDGPASAGVRSSAFPAAERWSVLDVDVGEDYVAAVSVDRPPARVSMLDWPSTTEKRSALDDPG